MKTKNLIQNMIVTLVVTLASASAFAAMECKGTVEARDSYGQLQVVGETILTEWTNPVSGGALQGRVGDYLFDVQNQIPSDLFLYMEITKANDVDGVTLQTGTTSVFPNAKRPASLRHSDKNTRVSVICLQK